MTISSSERSSVFVAFALGAAAVGALGCGDSSSSTTASTTAGATSSAASTSSGAGGATTGAGGASTASTGAGGAGTTTTSTGAGGGGGAPNLCAPMVDSAPQIANTMVNQPMPTASGGTLVPGTYYLTDETYYQGASFPNNKRTQMFIINADLTFTSLSHTDSDPDTIAGGTFSTAGTMMTATITCPKMAVLTQPFTATPTTFTIYDGAKIRTDTYTKQ